MDPIEHLSNLFEKFPGIGPRQAGRFVQYILRNAGARRELIAAAGELAGGVKQCQECMRYFAGAAGVCGLCANTQRDDTLLAVVASDADLHALERSGTYRGRYFVRGGTISLASDDMKRLRVRELLARVNSPDRTYAEIILAFPANPEGDATAVRVREELASSVAKHGAKITTLGRGLSTGSELEYADPETLKNALASRR